jgi:mRNA interferase MazF
MPVKRGEIYFVNLNPTKGREQAGTRPVLVLSADAVNALRLVATVEIGTKGDNIKQDYPTNVRVPSSASGLPIETVFLCFQIRSLDPSWFPAQAACSLPDSYMSKVEQAVRFCLEL